MVLAACSSYFQGLFTELPCRHPVVVLKDVRYDEMKAILEYMYRGEVNVAQNQLAALLKVAEALKVKGLVEENGSASRPKRTEEEGNAITTSTPAQAPPSSSVSSEECPPHSTGVHGGPYFSKIPYSLYGKSGERNRMTSTPPTWPVPSISGPDNPPSSTAHTPTGSGTINRCYDSAPSDMPPLRRKKYTNIMMSKETPILRSVLGQGQADSSQPVSLVCRPDSFEQGNHSPFTNGSGHGQYKSVKNEPTSGDAPSPYTDISNAEDDLGERQTISGMTPHSIYGESKGGISSGIANYVPTSRPEWKRYKQYTRNDIMSAIEAVRQRRMSCLKAAAEYGVPSRTLYDKVKKLGITTGRPIRRSSNSNRSGSFQYGFPGSGSVVYCGNEEENKFSPNVMDQSFLHHVLDAQNIKREDYEREAIAALVAASNTENNSLQSGNSSSPGNHERSPSPNLIKYAHRRSPSPVSPQQMEEDSNQVEDLSVSRKTDNPPPPPPSRVIMPPMSQAPAMVTTAGDQQENTE
ncbi:hypothetical protein GE061_001136 [Apolygus lucorum]|uniref:BTB domain-containing protein n=1 Tax=Apolygus lucorum TaxID=248454 RepID=A0A8S9Y9H5_APOLU|nr:hypothetical protein GE061_001136 [Apolygus lucorum]